MTTGGIGIGKQEYGWMGQHARSRCGAVDAVSRWGGARQRKKRDESVVQHSFARKYKVTVSVSSPYVAFCITQRLALRSPHWASTSHPRNRSPSTSIRPSKVLRPARSYVLSVRPVRVAALYAGFADGVWAAICHVVSAHYCKQASKQVAVTPTHISAEKILSARCDVHLLERFGCGPSFMHKGGLKPKIKVGSSWSVCA